MKTASTLLVVFVAVLLAGVSTAGAANPAEVAAEEQGLDWASRNHELAPRGNRSLELGRQVDLLLIPDSTNDRVMAFDPVTGNLLDADFIPSDPTNLSTPKCAIYKSDLTGFLVSDQLDDAVQEYDLDGNYVGIFAPAGGVNTAILDNARSIAYHPVTGDLLVAVAGGANADSIAAFDGGGVYLGNFVANGAGGLDSPWDILFTSLGYVPAGDSDAVHGYNSTTGVYDSDLLPVDTFPESLALAGNGNILIANWTGTQEGVMEVQPDGTLVGTYLPSPVDGPRGVFELPSGNLLVTDGQGVHEITRANTFVESKITGVSCHTITLAARVVPVELQSLTVE